MSNNQIEVKTPQFAESIEQAIVLEWKHSVGDYINEGEILVELETDKVVLEVTAPVSGVLEKIVASESKEVKEQEIIALMVEKSNAESKTETPEAQQPASSESIITPSARKEAVKQEVDANEVDGSGKKGRVTKQDVLSSIKPNVQPPVKQTETKSTEVENKVVSSTNSKQIRQREERIVPISRLRAKVAERLLASQHQSATLTTFNEVSMHAVMDLRKTYQDQFVEKYGIKLGFMSFFTLASVHALKLFPSVNAYFENEKIVYHDYCDVGIAMSTERGLMVPILKDADLMNFAEVEKAIIDFAQKAKNNKIEVGDLQGGTFSITNGGIFGSLLSTPILNPPQSAILGLHAINQTPVVENGEIVIRPVMKLALSYDHRIIDGREAVSFLVAVKQVIENPIRLLFGI